MMKLWTSCEVAVPVFLVLLVLQPGSVWAQDTSCLTQLAPCLNFLNGTKDVPDSCCDPLKTVIKSNPGCLCRMISNKGSKQAERAGINVTEAQQLPGKCGQHVNPFGCLTGVPASSKSSGHDSSAGASLLQLQSLMVAVVLSMIVQMLWMSNTVLA